MSTYERAINNLTACRALIAQLLAAHEELDRLQEHSPGSPAAATMRDKVCKLQAASEEQFLKAMEALESPHR